MHGADRLQCGMDRGIVDREFFHDGQKFGVFADQCGCNLAFSGSGGRKLAMILSLR
jgi:hypothetical protein